MKKHLDNPVFSVVSETAAELRIHAYVIGGFVRDIFLGKESKDIDIVAIGDGIELANKVSLKSIGVTWGLHNREILNLGNPAAIISDPNELIPTIEKILK